MSPMRRSNLQASRCTPSLPSSLSSQGVRNMVFLNLFFFIFDDFLCCVTLSTLFSLRSTLQEKTIRVLLISRCSRAQRTTTTDDPFQTLSKRSSLWVVYKSISPSLLLSISPSRTSPSSPYSGIRRSRRYPSPTFAGPLSWPAAIQRSANRPKSSTKEWYLGRSVTVEGPIVS